MENSSFKQILLPTVIATGAVFYAAISSFSSFTPSPRDSRPLPSGRLQYTLSKEYKDFAVRTVGLCILASVGTGLVVAEIVRRRSRSANRNQTEQRLFAQMSLFAPKERQTAVQYLESFRIEQALPLTPVRLNPVPAKTEASSATALAIAQPITIEVTQPEKICWVQIPGYQNRLFAIAADGHYYSFTRTEANWEAATKLVNQQRQRGIKVVLTHIGDCYMIWTWQPEAQPDADDE